MLNTTHLARMFSSQPQVIINNLPKYIYWPSYLQNSICILVRDTKIYTKMTSLEEHQRSWDSGGSTGECSLVLFLMIILLFWYLFLGLFPIIFITADIWRALKKRKHWILPVSRSQPIFSPALDGPQPFSDLVRCLFWVVWLWFGGNFGRTSVNVRVYWLFATCSRHSSLLE